jgi:hypothetical protein
MARCRLTRRNLLSARNRPAAHHRRRMSPSRQRVKRAVARRVTFSADSIGLVVASVLRSAPGTPSRTTVSVSSNPFRRVASASASGRPLKRTCGLFEMRLAHEQKERQAKGNLDEQRPDHGRPKLFHVQTKTLSQNEGDKNEGRYDNIQTEEAADSIGEQFMNEQPCVKTVSQHPRNELRIGQH